MGGQDDTDRSAAAPCRAAWGAAGRERAIAAAARRSHGVLTRRQLLELGLSGRAIDGRVDRGLLRAMHRGVYLLGPVVSPHAHEMAAVLACGPAAVLTHHSAACLWQLLPYPAQRAPLHVTVAARNPGRKPGLRVHRVRALPAAETTTRLNIPVTTPARTVLDLAATASAPDLERAVAEAFATRRASRAAILSLLPRHPRHPGIRRLRALLAADYEPPRIRSRGERLLIALIRRARLPRPEVNARICGWEADLLWREHRVAVELDGYASHSSPEAFERDYRKTADLEAAGVRVIRVSWTQLTKEPEVTLARIARALPMRT